MANIKIDQNYKGVAAGITDDANETIEPFRVNPITKALITDATFSGSVLAISDGTVKISGGTVNAVQSGVWNFNTSFSDGTVKISSGTVNIGNIVPVTGTFYQATQPISLALPIQISDGTVKISSGTVNIGSSLLALEAGGNLATIAGAVHNEDTGHSTGHPGIAVWGVRNEGGDDFSGTDKDYIPIALDAKGHIFIRNSDEIFNVTSIVSNGTISSGTINSVQSGTWNIGTLSVLSGGTININQSRTLKRASGTISATGTIISLVANKKIKVYALDLITDSTTRLTMQLTDSSGGTPLGTYVLQALTGTISGIAPSAVNPPNFLFSTTAGNQLVLVGAGGTCTYNVSYFTDDVN